jgi:altronate dehydratase
VAEDKIIDVKAEVILKKSPEFRDVAHKATAGVSDDEAIERNTLGSFRDNGESEEEGES